MSVGYPPQTCAASCHERNEARLFQSKGGRDNAPLAMYPGGDLKNIKIAFAPKMNMATLKLALFGFLGHALAQPTASGGFACESSSVTSTFTQPFPTPYGIFDKSSDSEREVSKRQGTPGFNAGWLCNGVWGLQCAHNDNMNCCPEGTICEQKPACECPGCCPFGAICAGCPPFTVFGGKVRCSTIPAPAPTTTYNPGNILPGQAHIQPEVLPRIRWLSRVITWISFGGVEASPIKHRRSSEPSIVAESTQHAADAHRKMQVSTKTRHDDNHSQHAHMKSHIGRNRYNARHHHRQQHHHPRDLELRWPTYSFTGSINATSTTPTAGSVASPPAPTQPYATTHLTRTSTVIFTATATATATEATSAAPEATSQEKRCVLRRRKGVQ